MPLFRLCLKLVHSACQGSCSVLSQQGRPESLLWVGKGVPGWEHPSLAGRELHAPSCYGNCTGRIRRVLSHLAHFHHKCYPSAPIFARSAKVTASLPLTQYSSCWNIFCIISCSDEITCLGGQWGSSSTWGVLLLCFPRGYLDCWESCLIPNPVTCRWGNCLSQAWMAGKSKEPW